MTFDELSILLLTISTLLSFAGAFYIGYMQRQFEKEFGIPNEGLFVPFSICMFFGFYNLINACIQII